MSPAAPSVKVTPKHFTIEEIHELRKQPLPSHVAIIPDGNRRWASKASVDSNAGHHQGSKMVVDLVEASAEIGIKTITFYTFSTENWLRPKEEVDYLMHLLEANIIDYKDRLVAAGVKLETIGDLSALSPKLQNLLAEGKEQSKNGTTLTLVLAINYGARDEICRAIRRIVDDCQAGTLQKEEINEETVSSYLDTASIGDPDLFIRTSGELRISNFLLWQLCYTELYIPTVLWPEFSPRHLLETVQEFQNRKRRFGL